MTVLDDEIGDLLASFRADEAVLDDATRLRIWDRLCDEVPDAAESLDAMAPATNVRRLRTRPRHRVLAVAAAVLVLLAVAGIALRPGPGRDDGTITAGTTEEEVSVPGLDELADEVAARPVVELGSSPEVAYAHLETRQTVVSIDGSEVVKTFEVWVDRDGTGRTVEDNLGDTAPPASRAFAEPGALGLGGVPVETVLALPDDAAAAEAAFLAVGDVGATARDVPVVVLDTLSHSGIPGPARAGMLRFLDQLGFAPVPASDLGPDTMRVEGLGPGYVLRADIDRTTGMVISRTWRQPRGAGDVRTVLTSDLRPDTQGE
jgi:hypothetical protein